MSNGSNAIVETVKASVANILGLVDQAARDRSSEELNALREEARQTMFMMIAAIVLADKKYAEGEKALLNSLVDWKDKPGGEIWHLNQHAEAWRATSGQAPKFFQTAVEHDKRHKTELACAIIQEVELIGNHTCVCDGEFEATEHEVVRSYILVLERARVAWNERHISSQGTAEGWQGV